MKEYITIRLKDKKLGREKVKREYAWGRNKHITIETETAKAKIISPRLAAYKLPDDNDGAWYHVIHIPTGFVIAFVHHYDLGMVKKTFEKMKWTLKNGNELHAYQNSFPFHIVCKLMYEIIDEKE